MQLRANTFLNTFKGSVVKGTYAFLLLLCLFPSIINAQQNIEDTKKQANKLFEDESFTEAYKLYAQLVANFPKDPEYNYRLGVCMIYSEADKKKCLPYLKQAASGGEDSPEDVYFYLGKAYHINYLFDDAIKCYNEFKKTASPALQKKLQVVREINACNNGKRLLSSLTDLEIKNKKQLNEADYFRAYDLKSIGGKLLVKPEELRTPIDKKKKEKSIVYLPKAMVSSKIFFSSYGDNTETGKDIYFVTKTSNGFGPPQKVQGINSEYDEDYPFLHPNGQTLYFSSKGFNSMGGYDIFKSTFDPNTNTWSAPENLQFPINSPDDDYLYITDSLEKNATFSTGRQSPPGKIDVLKITTERLPIDVLAIKGQVEQEKPEQGLNSLITITNMENNINLGVITANDKGEYKMQLPNGGKIKYSVETPGVQTQTAEVQLPVAEQSKPYKQEITYENGRLRVVNHFDENADEDTYLQYLDVIEKKAKLDVSSPEKKVLNQPEIVAVVNDSIEPKADKEPEIVEEEMGTANTNSVATTPTVNPPKLEPVAESTVEASSTTVAVNSNPLAEKTEEEKSADTKKAIPEGTYKDRANLAVKNADQGMQEAIQFDKDAKSVIETGEGLLADAIKNIADANEQIKSAASINDNTQKAEVLSDAYSRRASAQKDSAAAQNIVSYGNSLQAEANTKKLEAEKQMVSAKELLNSGNIVTYETAAPPANIAKKPAGETTKPKAKQSPNTKPVVAKVEPESAPVLTVISSNELTNKYEGNVQSGGNTPNDLKQKNISLSHYNREIDEAIKGNQQKLKRTKDPSQKQALNEEILSLQKQKAANTEQMALNKGSMLTSAQGVTNIQATNPAEAVQKIEELKSNLAVNDNANFDFNAYQNPEAQLLKVEADSRINDALARQKTLKAELDKSIETFLKSDGGNGNVSKSPAELTVEADALHEKALKTEAEAAKKQGQEKANLLTEAKRLENKATDTYLAASVEAQIKNQQSSSLNGENLSNLQKEHKGSETDLVEAQKLAGEASQMLQQAAVLREQAKTAPNKSSQLSKNFAAEEREAEAIQKQTQAIDLLKKSNPEFVLKTPAGIADGGEGNYAVQQQLDALNQSINEVAEIKIESYTKLSAANKNELNSLSEKVSEESDMLEQNPKLKSEVISANNKLDSANRILVQAENMQDKSQKVTLLISGVKKQNEALQQLIRVSNAMNPNAAPLVQNTNTSVATENIEENTEAPSKNRTGEPETNPENTTETANNASDNSQTAPENKAEEPMNVEGLVNAPELKSDSTSNQVIGYLKENPVLLVNPAAAKMYTASLEKLKKYEEEITNLNNGGVNTSAPVEVDLDKAQELKTKSEEITRESDNLNIQSSEIRTEAKTKEGAEKDALLAKANELENQALDKNIEASELLLQSNEINVLNNTNMIAAYFKKLKDENPTLYNELETKNNELDNTRGQIKSIREEANTIDNKGARYGALSNGIEREAELLQKQDEILDELRNTYPDFVYNPTTEPLASLGTSNAEIEKQKQQLERNQQEELTSLGNALLLEFETKKNKVPNNLSPANEQIRSLAMRLNAESKRLLVQSAQQEDAATKTKYLSRAVTYASQSLMELDKIAVEQVLVVSEPANTNLPETKQTITSPKETQAITEKKNATDIPAAVVRVEGLEIKPVNAYNDVKPIPLDAKIEDGLIFRVQIGAFRNRIPNNTFKGLSPLNAETTTNGFFRYTAGNFNKFELANAVKNDLRSLGYSDAFVVGFYNGKRIPLSEALDILTKEGKMIDRNAMQTAGITLNANVPKAAANPIVAQNLVSTKAIEKVNGLLYTIQIGVFNKQVTKTQLFSLRPIFTEALAGGLFRYAAGIYNNVDRLLTDKQKVIDFGVRDAFVTAYLNGKRIGFGEAKGKQQNDSTIKMETEEPVIFPSGEINPVPNSNTAPAAIQAPANIGPAFTNGVKEYPTPTADNGIKKSNQGVCFKVQIGAYSKQVPTDVAGVFRAIKNWPVESQLITNLYIYSVGNFSGAAYAKKLRDEIIGMGIADAFIVVYQDGKKLYGEVARKYLQQ